VPVRVITYISHLPIINALGTISKWFVATMNMECLPSAPVRAMEVENGRR
jgi:hypothetical protein